MSDVSFVIGKFTEACKLTGMDTRSILSRFLALQINAASWESVYVHSTANDGGKDLSSFKYAPRKGTIEAYVRTENCHMYQAPFWKQLFEGASISSELSTDPNVKQKLAVYHDFVAKVVNPVCALGEDQKLMLFFLMNTKQKNLKSLIYDTNLGIGLKRGQQNALYARMSEYKLKEDSGMNLAKEFGALISHMDLPVATVDHEAICASAAPQPSSLSPLSSSTTTTRGQKDVVIYSVKPSRAEGWDATKQVALAENAAVQECKQKMKLRFAPSMHLAHQLILSAINPEPKHWKSSQLPVITNENLALAQEVRTSVVANIGTKEWSELLKVVGYGETKRVASTRDCVDFFENLAKAIPQADRQDWTSKDLVQMFVTAHLPNWERHWKENWALNVNIERAVKRYVQEHPVPSDEFVHELVEGFAK